MNGLSHQTDPQCRTDTADRIEARLRAGAERLVQGFSSQARRLGNLAHPAGARDVTQCCREKSRIVRIKDVGEVGDNRLFVGE